MVESGPRWHYIARRGLLARTPGPATGEVLGIDVVDVIFGRSARPSPSSATDANTDLVIRRTTRTVLAHTLDIATQRLSLSALQPNLDRLHASR